MKTYSIALIGFLLLVGELLGPLKLSQRWQQWQNHHFSNSTINAAINQIPQLSFSTSKAKKPLSQPIHTLSSASMRSPVPDLLQVQEAVPLPASTCLPSHSVVPLHFWLQRPQTLQMRIFQASTGSDMAGVKVKAPQGWCQLNMFTSQLPAGIYLCEIQNNRMIYLKKILVIKE